METLTDETIMDRLQFLDAIMATLKKAGEWRACEILEDEYFNLASELIERNSALNG